MWPFKIRAETTDAQTTDAANDVIDDPILRAALGDDSMSAERAMEIPTFAACVRKISEIGATVNFRLYKREEDGNIVEVKDDIRTKLLNEDTGDTLDGVQFKRALIRDYLTEKGGYAYVNRNGLDVVSLHYVEPGEISFLYNSDPIFKMYRVMVRGKEYFPHEFIKILRNTKDGRTGRSIILENAAPLNVAYNTMRYENSIVKRGGGKKGYIKTERLLIQETLDKLKEAWRKLFITNEENVVVLNKGLEFQEASATSVEMQINENKQTNGKDICKMFTLAPGIIDGAETDKDRTSFAKDTLKPIFNIMQSEFNRILLLESEKGSYFFAPDDSELTEGNMLERYQAYALAKRNGFMQIDEIRENERLPQLGMNYVTLGLQDVLYDPKTGQMIVPNMGEKGKIDDKNSITKGGENGEGAN